MKIDELINKNYDKLTQNDHQIFNYIIKNQQECKEMTC